jgi:GT2 family glycosyltransferase
VCSALSQSVPVEVLVVDDGSTDHTAEMIRTEFPGVRLDRSETSQGYIVQRNRAAQLSKGKIIFSIDDDAIFTSSHTVAQTLAEFDHPRVGAVAIPYIEPHKSPLVHQQTPFKDRIIVTDVFKGTAHALRRDVFLQLGGYREKLVHQGEESDFCVRMLEAGYVVRLGSADLIHHMESPRRDFRRMDFYGRRNDVLFAWHNVPFPHFLPHLAATSFNGLKTGFNLGRPGRMMRGLLAGYIACAKLWSYRLPISKHIYKLHRELKKGSPKALEEIELRLPPLCKLKTEV